MDIELGIFLYAICCSKQYKEDNLLTKCPICQKVLEYNKIGLYPKNSEQQRVLEEMFIKRNGYKLTCTNCGNIFLSENTSVICPKCGCSIINFVPNIDGFKYQAICHN